MPRKRKLSNLSERCRFCLIDHGCMIELFSETVESKTKDLMKCTSIDIKHEKNLPENICHLCLYKLEMWNEFKEQFLRSNRLLLQYVEISELSDNTSKRKRTDSQQSIEQNLSNNENKKSDSELPSLVNADNIKDKVPEEICISDDPIVLPKESSSKVREILSDTAKDDTESITEESSQMKSPVTTAKMRSLIGRRGRTNERRRASMKRWVARKRALLAATGQTISDSDSVASDDTHLSPVQKARAKTNADKEAERQKRLTKALKMLETNMTSKYSFNSGGNIPMSPKADANTRQTRSQKTSSANASQNDNEHSVFKESNKQDDASTTRAANKNTTGKENTLQSSNRDKNVETDNKTQGDCEMFTPHSVKSEIQVGDSTYIVTSTLVMAGPQYINKAQLNNHPKECQLLSIDDDSQEKNTDIIDAVQLRRINPVSSNSQDKKSLEKCLSIEVEGTEVEALKKVQLELAGFVEKEMKDRLFGMQKQGKKNEPGKNARKSSYQTLDEQLKIIVEKAIRKNYENFVTRDQEDAETVLCNKRSGTVPAVFIKTAMNSKKFQPKVILKRLNIMQESQIYRINNLQVLESDLQRNSPWKEPKETFRLLHKRLRVPPAKYSDYDVSILDSDSDSSDDDVVVAKPRNAVSNKPIAQLTPINKTRTSKTIRSTEKVVTESASESMDSNTALQNPTSSTTERKVENRAVPTTDSSETTASEKHICGVCNQCFDNRKDVETHMLIHKADNPTQKPAKHKMMRCKRCHEIVEARYVKVHVCRSLRQMNKCYVCNSTFRTEKLLVQHLNNHDQSEFNIENITKSDGKRSSNVTALQATRNVTIGKSEESTKENQSNRTETVNAEKEKLTQVKFGKAESMKVTQKPKETYTCFICDKIFTDEDILKDHLQKHCNELSEDEQSMDKEQYQCAICGESQESGDALEVHVEKHLFDDEDDNPNLINISNDSDKGKDESFECSQCSETFNSLMLLEMHKQVHEEEAAIAEWERQGIKSYENQCMICDDIFETEEELSEHLDVHNGNAHTCQLCDKPFLTLEELRNHVETH